MWPKVSGSKHTSTHPNFLGQNVSMCPMIVPKFVSDPGVPVKPGYQEAHKIYDEMQQFFTQKAMSVHQGKVVVIKTTMMSLKPGHKNPSVILVHETKDAKSATILIIFAEYFQDHFKHTCIHWCSGTQEYHIFHTPSTLHEMVQELYPGY